MLFNRVASTPPPPQSGCQPLPLVIMSDGALSEVSESEVVSVSWALIAAIQVELFYRLIYY